MLPGIMSFLIGAGAARLIVRVSPSVVRGSGAVATVTTGSTTATATEGSGSYSYLWKMADDVTNITPVSPNSPTTAFRSLAMEPGEVRSGFATCTVVDLISGQSVESPGVSVETERFS